MNALLEKARYLLDHFSGKKATAVGGAIAVIWAAMPTEVSVTLKFWATIGLTAVLVVSWALDPTEPKPPKAAKK